MLAQIIADSALRGIRGVEREGAPDTYAALRAEIDANPGAPIPISPDFSGASILGREGNVRFRAWHDMEHYATGIGFGVAGEIAIEPHGAARLHGSDVRFLHRVEIVGQTLHYARHGRYPEDQRAFMVHAFAYGLASAIERGGF